MENQQQFIFGFPVESELDSVNAKELKVLQEPLVEIYEAIFLLPKLHDAKGQKLIVYYKYSFEEDCLFLLLGYNEKIFIYKLIHSNSEKLKQLDILKLFTLYENNNQIIDSIVFIETQIKVFNLLVRPIFQFIDYKNISIDHIFAVQDICINSKNIFFNLTITLDVLYRIQKIDKELPIMTLITQKPISVFIDGLSKIKLPCTKDMIVFYGLNKQDSEENLKKCNTEVEKNLCKEREFAYKAMLDIVKREGGIVEILTNEHQFEKAFNLQNKGRSIQIISHFNFECFFTENLSRIKIKDIMNILRNMNMSEKLRDDIAIDANTCNNHSSLFPMYNEGIRYIISSLHNLNSTLTAFMFYELYSCNNAKLLQWNYPYLDGKTYLHEAWSKVTRCLYTMMYNNKQILTPTSWNNN
ncbi:MAG: hypothetical protein FWC41_02245 [Firmicutes bacterium]|nr:hypothetical protein [Bacillota bacterium]